MSPYNLRPLAGKRKRSTTDDVIPCAGIKKTKKVLIRRRRLPTDVLYYLHEFCDWDTKRNLEEAMEWGRMLPRRLPKSRIDFASILMVHSTQDLDLIDPNEIQVYLPITDNSYYMITRNVRNLWYKDYDEWIPVVGPNFLTLEKATMVKQSPRGERVEWDVYGHTRRLQHFVYPSDPRQTPKWKKDLCPVEEKIWTRNWRRRYCNILDHYTFDLTYYYVMHNPYPLLVERIHAKETCSKSLIDWKKMAEASHRGSGRKSKYPQWLIDRELARQKQQNNNSIITCGCK